MIKTLFGNNNTHYVIKSRCANDFSFLFTDYIEYIFRENLFTMLIIKKSRLWNTKQFDYIVSIFIKYQRTEQAK